MKRILSTAIFGILNVVTITMLISSIGCTKSEEREIKIGAILPLTGDLASYGENAKDGITLFADEINSQGGIKGKKLIVTFEDSNGQAERGVTAFKKLIGITKVIAIIGDVASSPTLAFAPIANTEKCVVLSPAASSPDITNAGPYIYRVWPSDDFEADRMADYAKKSQIKSVALLYVNNDYGHAMVKEFKKRIPGSAITILNEESFDQNSSDMRGQLSKIKNSAADYIYLISYPKDSVIILRQYKEMGLKSKLLSTSSFEDPLILKEAGNIAEGAVFTSPIPPQANDADVLRFKEAYLKRFGKQPGLVADYGYDSLKVIVESVKLANDISKEGVYKGIEKVKDIKGATGIINFDKNGDVVKPAGIKTVKDLKYVWREK